jgi:hypothetical protein
MLGTWCAEKGSLWLSATRAILDGGRASISGLVPKLQLGTVWTGSWTVNNGC